MKFQFDYTNRLCRPRRAAEMSHNRMIPRRLRGILIQIPHRIPIQILHGTITVTPGAGASTTNTTHCICLTHATCPCPISRSTNQSQPQPNKKLKNLIFHLFMLFIPYTRSFSKTIQTTATHEKEAIFKPPQKIRQPETAIGNVADT